MPERISKTDFDKVDLRVGKIVRAERIEGSRKLLRLIVNLGNEERQVVAGLAEFYSPEDLVNKYVIVVTNLEPRRIFGHESQGMILATCDDKPAIITLERQSDEYIGKRVC